VKPPCRLMAFVTKPAKWHNDNCLNSKNMLAFPGFPGNLINSGISRKFRHFLNKQGAPARLYPNLRSDFLRGYQLLAIESINRNCKIIMIQGRTYKTRYLHTICSFTFCLCLMPFLILGCGPSDQAKDKVVLVVGSRQITTDQLKRDMEFISADMDVPDRDRNRIREQILGLVIDHYLILEYGRKMGISVSENEVQRVVKDIKKGYTEGAFKDALLRGYVDPEQWEERIREQFLVDKVIKKVTENITPPDYQDVKRYFEDNKDEFKSPEMLEFRQIVTRSREEAEALLKRLNNGEKMPELAKKYSIGPEAEKGGKVGWVARSDLEESMEKALFSLPLGKTSPVVKTPYGFHIFEVLSVRPEGVKQLPEVIREIESRLLIQRRELFCKKWLGDLRSQFEIKINQDILNEMETS
jgi:peptidyl-prolyl cis-trans isomerase C